MFLWTTRATDDLPSGACTSLHGLYAVTPDLADTRILMRQAGQALKGGALALQYRNKRADALLRLEQARALRDLTRDFGVPLIVNDDVALAVEVAADGVHLGEGDASIEKARTLLGARKMIGISCYNQLTRARSAVAAGADYVAFGAFFPSGVKPHAVKADAALLRVARAELAVPIVAIGGITPQNGAALLAAGADALAVISALFEAPDIQAAAREFATLSDQDRAS